MAEPVEPVEYERDGRYVMLRTQPQHDSGFDVGEVWVPIDGVDAVNDTGFGEEEACWLSSGNETYRVAGKARAVVRALSLASDEFFAEEVPYAKDAP